MPRHKQHSEGGDSPAAAILVVLAILVLALFSFWAGRHRNAGAGRRSPHESYLPHEGGAPGEDSPDEGAPPGDGPERRSVHAAVSRLYSTADVDPLLTGQLYGHADFVRPVYAQRTSHGDVRGLAEYSSAGGPGDVGVDVGPYGLEEYGGAQAGFDDGIPATWALPSTPVRWYGPKQRDYYGPEGATVYAEGLYTLSEPDHDPLVG